MVFPLYVFPLLYLLSCLCGNKQDTNMYHSYFFPQLLFRLHDGGPARSRYPILVLPVVVVVVVVVWW